MNDTPTAEEVITACETAMEGNSWSVNRAGDLRMDDESKAQFKEAFRLIANWREGKP